MPNKSRPQSKGPSGPQVHPYGSVAKLIFLSKAAKLPAMSRSELALLIVLADMANPDTGIAWPSFATLAERAGISDRHAKTAIKKLIAGGFIKVTEQGTRIRSNRYQINLSGVGSDLDKTTHPSAVENTRVVNPSVRGSDLEGPDVVNSSSPESVHPSEHKASEGCDRSEMDGGAPNAPPFGAALARQPNSRKDRFPEFWEAIGHRATVAESEQAISEFLSSGIEYGDIVAGGRRWAAYNVATGGRRRASPLQWLQKEKWRDDWTLSAVRNGTPRAAETGAKPSRGSVKPPSAKTEKLKPKQNLNLGTGQKVPETRHKANGTKKTKKVKNRRDEMYQDFHAHRFCCKICINTQQEDNLCETGKNLYNEYKLLSK